MHIHSPNDLAIYIKAFRKKHRLSQQAIADLVGLKQTTISAFENNPHCTKMDTLFRILAATNLELSIQTRGDASNDIITDEDSW